MSTASDLDGATPPPPPSTRDVEQWREVVAWKDRALTSRTPVLSPLRDGVIATGDAADAEVVDATGLIALPGLVGALGARALGARTPGGGAGARRLRRPSPGRGA